MIQFDEHIFQMGWNHQFKPAFGLNIFFPTIVTKQIYKISNVFFFGLV